MIVEKQTLAQLLLAGLWLLMVKLYVPSKSC